MRWISQRRTIYPLIVVYNTQLSRFIFRFGAFRQLLTNVNGFLLKAVILGAANH